MKPLVIALAFAGLSQAQDKTLTGIEVIERYRKATNAETLEKAENHVITSKMEFVGRGMSGTVVEYRKKPKLHYSEAEFEGVGKIVSGSDGTVAWTSNPMQGPRLMDGDELKQTLRRGVNDWKEKQAQYSKIENAGSETVEGEDCYKVVLTLADGGRQDTQFYSKASGLLLKQITTGYGRLHRSELTLIVPIGHHFTSFIALRSSYCHRFNKLSTQGTSP